MKASIYVCFFLSTTLALSQPVVEIASLPSGPTWHFKMHRGYGYVENGSAIDIVDFNTPLSPSFLYQFEMASFAQMAFTFLGDTLYLADDNLIEAYNVIDPASPQFLGSHFHTHGFRNLEGHNGLIFALSSECGLEIYNYTSVTDPVLLSTTECGSGSHSALFRDSLLFVAPSDEIYCFNVSNPENPTLVGLLGLPRPKLAMVAEGNYLYIANCDTGVKIVDISDPANMSLVQTVPVDYWCRDVAIQGDYLYATDWDGVVFIIDISDPENAFTAAVFDPTGRQIPCGDIEVHGMFLLMSNYGDGVRVLDATDPIDPSTVAIYDVPEASYGILQRGDYLYAGAYTDGLRIVDITDIYNPIDVNSAFLPITSWNLALYDSLVVVPDIYASDVYFMDVSDPYSPEVIGIADHVCRDVATTDSLLVCAVEPYELEISDISDVENPDPQGSIEFTDNVRSIVCKNNYAYISHLSNETDSISVVDLSNPNEPQVVNSIPIDGPYDLAIKDELLLVAAGGLHIFDISDPPYPEEIGSSEPVSGHCRGIAFSGNFAYLCCTWTAELKTYLIIDPTNPIEVDTYYAGLGHLVEDAAAWDDLVAITCMNGGIRILRNTIWYDSVEDDYQIVKPQSLVLHPPVPNPFNSSTILRFQLPAMQSISLDVYDIQGRLLKTVACGVYPAGDHILDFNGSELASGMYFIRLAGSGGAEVRKITLVK